MYYPRVLIINNEPLHERSATGLTMCSLFKDWPRDRLAQMTTGSVFPDSDLCPRWVTLSPANLNLPQIFRHYLAQREARPSPSSSPYTADGALKVARINYLRIVKNHAAQFLYLRNYDINEPIRKWIREFKPDIIYSMLYELNVMRLVLQVSDLMNIPVIPHFMDDWPATLHLKYPVRALLHTYSKKLLYEILNRSRLCLTISNSMAEEYQRRYGKQCESAMLCIDRVKIFSLPQNHENEVVFTYVGGLHLKRWESLLKFRAALIDARSAGTLVRCHIYAHRHDIEKYRHLLHYPPIMTMERTLCHEEVEAVQRKSDCLIYIESFGRWQKLFTRYSVSSKIPEYLSSGRPILAYGPEGIASIEQLRSYKCGKVVTSRKKESLTGAIIEIAKSLALRKEYARNAISACLSNYESSSQRKKFRTHIVMGQILTRSHAPPS